jgi:hypothetical protein
MNQVLLLVDEKNYVKWKKPKGIMWPKKSSLKNLGSYVGDSSHGCLAKQK